MGKKITRPDLLVQRSGAVWYMPWRVDPDTPSVDRALLGVVEKNPRTRKPEWRFKCADCKPFHGPLRRTRREALLDLIDHWNEDQRA